MSTSTIPKWASMWIENPPIGTTISSMPIRARSSRSWSAASALQRIDVPNAATRGVSLTNVPPSSIPAPMIVWRIGIPSAATARVTLASSPRRMSGAIRPMTTPPGNRHERVARVDRLREARRERIGEVHVDALRLERLHQAAVLGVDEVEVGRRAVGPVPAAGRVDQRLGALVPRVRPHLGELVARAAHEHIP